MRHNPPWLSCFPAPLPSTSENIMHDPDLLKTFTPRELCILQGTKEMQEERSAKARRGWDTRRREA